jgi:hypothetical protein
MGWVIKRSSSQGRMTITGAFRAPLAAGILHFGTGEERSSDAPTNAYKAVVRRARTPARVANRASDL